MNTIHLTGNNNNNLKSQKVERSIRLPNLREDRLGTFDFISWWEREKVQAAHVMVVGAGALGNEILKNLTLMGIGNLFVVDFDHIEAANLSRSILYSEADNGKPKALVAARRLKELNPEVNVQYFQGDVTSGLGLGVFRRMDGIVGGLDNREARLAINRFAHWLGKPWVDGAIQELWGLVRVFGPGEGACYECTLTEQARREMALRYSCPLLARQNILLGKVPTTPTISSIIGGMQAQEVLKLIHDMPVNFGQVTHFNGLTNHMHTTEYVRREDCESHWTYGEITELKDFSAARSIVADLLRKIRSEMGPDAIIELDQEMVLGFSCPVCGTYEEVFRPLSRVKYDEGICPTCGELRQLDLTHVVDGTETFVNRTLIQIGIPPLHIVRARNSQEYRFYELTGDLNTALHFNDFSEIPPEKLSQEASLTIRPGKSKALSIKRSETQRESKRLRIGSGRRHIRLGDK